MRLPWNKKVTVDHPETEPVRSLTGIEKMEMEWESQRHDELVRQAQAHRKMLEDRLVEVRAKISNELAEIAKLEGELHPRVVWGYGGYMSMAMQQRLDFSTSMGGLFGSLIGGY